MIHGSQDPLTLCYHFLSQFYEREYLENKVTVMCNKDFKRNKLLKVK